MTQRTEVQVQVGDQVLERDDARPFGAVMEVHPNALQIDIENFGPFSLPATAVRAVHEGKVIVDVSKLPADIRERIAHAHDRENQY